mgnify:CR=1 FL=1
MQCSTHPSLYTMTPVHSKYTACTNREESSSRLVGDPFQDFVCSHAIKFGKGSKVERDYIYFCALTGVGEKGKVAICVNNDGGADSGAPGEIDVELVCTKAPTAYTYSAT